MRGQIVDAFSLCLPCQLVSVASVGSCVSLDFDIRHRTDL